MPLPFSATALDVKTRFVQEAVELGPQNPMARANLCLALSLAGRPQEAIPHAQQAVTLTNAQNPLLLDMLGRLYAQAGRVPEAVEPTRQAALMTSAAIEA